MLEIIFGNAFLSEMKKKTITASKSAGVSKSDFGVQLSIGRYFLLEMHPPISWKLEMLASTALMRNTFGAQKEKKKKVF